MIPQTKQVIDIITWIIVRNRETLPVKDMAVLEKIKMELENIICPEVGRKSDAVTSALNDIARKLIRFFVDNEYNSWTDNLE